MTGAWAELTVTVVTNTLPTDMAALYRTWVDTNPGKANCLSELVAETVATSRQAVAANPASVLDDEMDTVPTGGFRHALNLVIFNLGMEMGVQSSDPPSPPARRLPGSQGAYRATTRLRVKAYCLFSRSDPISGPCLCAGLTPMPTRSASFLLSRPACDMIPPIQRKDTEMKKALKVIGILLLVVIVGLWIAVVVVGGKTIKTAINTAGPKVLKVPVTLADAEFRPLRGLVRLEGLHIGNPEGFKSDRLFDLGSIKAELDPRSLLSDTIHITSIYIAEPKVTYELALGKSNVGALIEALEGEAKPEAPKAEEKPAGKDKPKVKVIIDKIVIEGGKLTLASTLTGGVGAPIPLPKITLKDIGKEEQGTTVGEVFKKVLGAIGGAATSSVGAVGGALKDGGGAVVDAGKAVGGATADAAKAVGEGTVDAVKAAGGGATDAAKAVGEGAGNLLKGAGNLITAPFKGDEKPAEEKKP